MPTVKLKQNVVVNGEWGTEGQEFDVTDEQARELVSARLATVAGKETATEAPTDKKPAAPKAKASEKK